MKRIAVIQARMGSTRLPGKVLMPLAGASVLACVIDRVRAAALLDGVVVATSDLAGDDAVCDEARRVGAEVYRGSADDVLSRFTGAAHAFDAGTVVRITADCPLVDGRLIDEMLEAFASKPCDYLSNTLVRTFPRGLDAEIVRTAALQRAECEAAAPYEREHVTPYLYQHPELFALSSFVDETGTNRSAMRWTLDTADDYRFLQAVYAQIPHAAPREISIGAVLELLAVSPELQAVNASVRQKDLHA